MVVSASFPVVQRPWKGYEDPGLPVGMWVAQGTILGDATGGTANIRFAFKGEGEPLGARFYSLEQIEAHSTRTALRDGALIIENFDILGTTGLVNRRIHLAFLDDGVTDSQLVPGELKLPVFMGRPTLVDIATELQLTVVNVLAETTFFTGQGYIWEPRSLLEDGGLRRPIDSLYG